MTLSRRTFFKGLAAIAAATALPLSKIEALAEKRRFDFIVQEVNCPAGEYTFSSYFNFNDGRGWMRLVKHITHKTTGPLRLSIADLMEDHDMLVLVGGYDDMTPDHGGPAPIIADGDKELSIWGTGFEPDGTPQRTNYALWSGDATNKGWGTSPTTYSEPGSSESA